MITDLILAEGDIAVDENGFIHGPLRLGTDQLHLYAAGRGWDFHGIPTRHVIGHRRLVSKWEPPVTVPPAIADGSMVAIRFNREVASDLIGDLDYLIAWSHGVRSFTHHLADDIIPNQMGRLLDITFLLKTEMEKTKP
jgi:hypothetical protein